MIVCTRCGFHNEDTDTFCGSCAGFLEWSGQVVKEDRGAEPAPEPEPEATPEPEHAGFMERVKDRIGLGDKEEAEGAGGAVTAPPAERLPVGGGPRDGISAPAAAVPAATAATASPAPQATPAGSRAAAAGSTAASRPTAAPLGSPPPPPPVTARKPDEAAGQARSAPAPSVAAPSVGAAPAGRSTAGAANAAPTAAATPATAAPPAPATPAAAPSAASPAAPPPVRPAPPSPPGAPTRTGHSASGPTDATAPGPIAPVQPEAVKPTAAKTRPTPRAKIAPTREINPGDLVCGQCSEGNDPDRRFCRRCGASLQQAMIFTLPWYRRLWLRLTTRKTRQAGDRPRARRRAFGGSGPGWLTSWVTRIIVLAVVVLVILAFVGPWRNTIHHRASRYYHNVVNVVHPTYNPVHPDSARGTSFTLGHPAEFAIDGAANTSWFTGGRGTGKGQRLLIKFGNSTNVDKIGFLLGDQDNPAAFLAQGRPAEVLLTFPGSHPYNKTLTLKDSPSFQSYTISAKNAVELIITIESVQPAPPGTHAAIAEVELFKKS